MLVVVVVVVVDVVDIVVVVEVVVVVVVIADMKMNVQEIIAIKKPKKRNKHLVRLQVHQL